MLLIEIAPPRFDVDLDLRYATADNLTGSVIYQRPLCLLRPEAAEHLARAVVLARGIGCRLRVFDAFRPVEAQWRLWHALPDATYIADPRIGSHHSRGVAVDLTLTDAAGRELDMGTGFDDMTALSGHGRTDLPPEVQRNRAVLTGIMAATGWLPYPFEWWHYQLPESGRYPLLSDSAAGGRMMTG
ncbi:MAG: D-alanyl-D-alanine dipeptidase [Rhodospirillaceae bacterium]